MGTGVPGCVLCHVAVVERGQSVRGPASGGDRQGVPVFVEPAGCVSVRHAAHGACAIDLALDGHLAVRSGAGGRVAAVCGGAAARRRRTLGRGGGPVCRQCPRGRWQWNHGHGLALGGRRRDHGLACGHCSQRVGTRGRRQCLAGLCIGRGEGGRPAASTAGRGGDHQPFAGRDEGLSRNG